MRTLAMLIAINVSEEVSLLCRRRMSYACEARERAHTSLSNCRWWIRVRKATIDNAQALVPLLEQPTSDEDLVKAYRGFVEKVLKASNDHFSAWNNKGLPAEFVKTVNVQSCLRDLPSQIFYSARVVQEAIRACDSVFEEQAAQLEQAFSFERRMSPIQVELVTKTDCVPSGGISVIVLAFGYVGVTLFWAGEARVRGLGRREGGMRSCSPMRVRRVVLVCSVTV